MWTSLCSIYKKRHIKFGFLPNRGGGGGIQSHPKVLKRFFSLNIFFVILSERPLGSWPKPNILGQCLLYFNLNWPCCLNKSWKRTFERYLKSPKSLNFSIIYFVITCNTDFKVNRFLIKYAMNQTLHFFLP